MSFRNRDRELNEELDVHVRMASQARTERGESANRANEAARREFGNESLVRETTADQWGGRWLESLLQDLRYALRMLRKSPGFTAVAILTFMLGIGATTAVFSLVNTILLKPLPFPGSERIVSILRRVPPGLSLGYEEVTWGLTDFHRLGETTKVFERLGAFKSDSFNLTGVGEPARLDGIRASAGFFSVLGTSPALGRMYTEEEDQPGREREVILSDRLWREKFGADRGVLGRTVELNGTAYVVIGVMPPGFVFPRAEEMPASFEFPREAQLWVPLALPAVPIHPWDPDELAFIGRLARGRSVAQGQAEMDRFASLREKENPRGKGWFNSRVIPLARQVAGDTRQPLLLMLGAVAVVLLIACANVAGLLLARSFSRRKEFTLRAILGAGPWRLPRQILTESVVLAIAGGFAGVFFAKAAIYFIRIFGPSNIPRLQEAAVDFRVFAFALGIAVVAGTLSGMSPALGTLREDLVNSLQEGSQRALGSRSGVRMRQALLVSEIAFALVLVIAAGLLARTFACLLGVNGGFNPDKVLTFQMSLSPAKYSDMSHTVALYRMVWSPTR